MALPQFKTAESGPAASVSPANAKLADWSLAIACTMANERELAAATVTQFLEAASVFRQVTFIAVLDRVSTDGTLDILRELAKKELRLKVIYAEESRCHIDFFIRGYREALALPAIDWILEVDAGFSHRPQDLANFFPAMLAGAEAVFGTRFGKGGVMRDAPLKRRMISRGGTFLANTLLGTRLSDMTSGYEMFRRHVLEYVLTFGIQSRGHFFQTEIKTDRHRFRVADVPIVYTSPSSTVGRKALSDAFGHLGRLFRLRLKGELY